LALIPCKNHVFMCPTRRGTTTKGLASPNPAIGVHAISKKSKRTVAAKSSANDKPARVLKASGEPMGCKDMVDAMLSKGLWSTEGLTPGATIYAAVIREIAKKGSDSRFKKTDRGLFAYAGQPI